MPGRRLNECAHLWVFRKARLLVKHTWRRPSGSPGCGGLEGTRAAVGGPERDPGRTEPPGRSGPEGRSAEAAPGVVTPRTGPAGEEHGPPAERLPGRLGESGAASVP